MRECHWRTIWICVGVGISVGVLIQKGVVAETWLVEMAKKEFGTVSAAEEKLFLKTSAQ